MILWKDVSADSHGEDHFLLERPCLGKVRNLMCVPKDGPVDFRIPQQRNTFSFLVQKGIVSIC